MRSNSGDDEGRNNLHDPTLRERANDAEATGKEKPGKGKASADSRQGRKD